MVNDNLLLWVHEHMPDSFRPKAEAATKSLSDLALPDGQRLRALIESSAGLAPGVFRRSEFRLGLHRDSTKPSRPTDPERKMCFDLWQKKISFGLGDGKHIARVHSYEVPLVVTRKGKASDGNYIKKRTIDLLAASSWELPIIIEAKHHNMEPKQESDGCTTAVQDLFGHFMQSLCYAVTLRYTWNESPEFRTAWHAIACPDDSTRKPLPVRLDGIPIPIVLAANSPYWKREFKWGHQQQQWHELDSLMRVAESCGYPVYAGWFDEIAPDLGRWDCKFWPWKLLSKPSKDGGILIP